MNSNPFSNLPLLAVVLALLVAVGLTAPVAAVTVSQGAVPSSAAVGEDVTVSFELNDLYEGTSRAWTLNATTELTNVSWEIRTYDNAGDQIDRTDASGNVTEYRIDADQDIDSVEITIRGTVPEVETYSYDPEERFLLVSLAQVREGGGSDTIDEVTVHHYTEETGEARAAIDSAQVAVDGVVERDGESTDAQRLLGNAIEAYNAGNFDLAVELSSQAEEAAGEAASSADRRQLAIYAALGFISVAVLAGVVYWFRSRRNTYDRLG